MPEPTKAEKKPAATSKTGIAACQDLLGDKERGPLAEAICLRLNHRAIVLDPAFVAPFTPRSFWEKIIDDLVLGDVDPSNVVAIDAAVNAAAVKLRKANEPA